MDLDASLFRPTPGAAIAAGNRNLQQFEDPAFHRWYNFILGFSDHLVARLLDELSVSSNDIVLDAFCGTGTTLIECAKRGIASIGVDANPFAAFATEAKTLFHIDPRALRLAAARVENRYRTLVSSNRKFTSEAAYIYLDKSGMLSRGWISKRPLRKALALREAIQRGQNDDLNHVLMLALAADLSSNIGNMKFGPQIYRGPTKKDIDPIPLFRARVGAMIHDLQHAHDRHLYSKPVVLVGDARGLKPILRKKYGSDIPKINFAICSPPYPTEHDYTRHTRLELTFTDGISTHACLRRVKQSMIRSHTKGIYKGDADQQRVRGLASVEALATEVEAAIVGKTSGFEKLYPTVVRSYFGGMKRHFGSLFRLMKSGGRLAYVVGDQAAYLRIPVRTAMLLGETAESVGFKVQGIELWRRRWSTGMNDYLDENILFLCKR